ncbi:phosphodiester glycosidase family protein [Acidiferrimicrobium sp. IK]|uniref:phosphodiester glycosidase family protein n=1 Tax=Acidiferrimicrobium sp. IK TaxID=2871700 RepID=UPI0021CB5EFC|nr:phosphodiester glycosidase family protein [Acidiferrimicrobium sp. IK]MCU4185996.1 phosphodiester glycosidase family protein [Acidiferrimicrobium sp. IK]
MPRAYDWPESYWERTPDSDPGLAVQPERKAVPSGRPPRRRRHPVLVATASVVGAFCLLVAISVVAAARTPGNSSFDAKWADWLRSHHAGGLVGPLEQWYYNAKAPSKGGQPRSLNPVPNVRRGAAIAAPVATHLPPPAAVPLVVTPAVPGEGQWQPTGPLVNGHPAIYVAQYRADTVYTSQITTAVWIDPTALRVRLVPGAKQPGGTWPEPPFLSGELAARAVAAFNGGFRLQDAQGGFYDAGRTAVALRTGAASLVLYKNGTVNIGAWGSEVTMTPNVSAVLQNLVPLVDGGNIAPDATYHDTRVWGATLGASTVVARSGIGVTADGALVYVAGPALTAKTLAEALQRAGAVRAMTLDINPEWVTFNFFSHPDPANPAVTTGTKLYPQMQRSADRYLGPTPESRDFFTVSTS